MEHTKYTKISTIRKIPAIRYTVTRPSDWGVWHTRLDLMKYLGGMAVNIISTDGGAGQGMEELVL